MREIVALLVLYAASRLIDVESEEASFVTGLALLVSLGALVFLAAALAERLNPNIKKWHRITPGTSTKMDEQEWQKIGKRGASETATVARAAPSAYSAPPSAAAKKIPPPPPPPPVRRPEPKPEVVFYDSGFDDTAAAKKTTDGPDRFDEIFGDDKDDSSR